jgi:hypothetical protein
MSGHDPHVSMVENPPAAMFAELVANMRARDAEEVYLASGRAPAEVLKPETLRSDYTVAAMAGDRVACIFGAARQTWLGDTVAIWELGTREIDRRPRLFLRHSREGVGMIWTAMGEHVARGVNQVWAGNALSLRWLTWLGASLGMPRPFGPHGAVFTPFTLERSDCHV